MLCLCVSAERAPCQNRQPRHTHTKELGAVPKRPAATHTHTIYANGHTANLLSLWREYGGWRADARIKVIPAPRAKSFHVPRLIFRCISCCCWVLSLFASAKRAYDAKVCIWRVCHMERLIMITRWWAPARNVYERCKALCNPIRSSFGVGTKQSDCSIIPI